MTRVILIACAPAVPCRLLTSTDTVSALDASLDPNAGGTLNGKPIFSAAQVAAYLNRTGGGWVDGTNDSGLEGRQNNIGDDNKVITFGFFDTQAQVAANGYTYIANNAQGVPTNYGLAEYFNFAAFTAAQRDATRETMQSWDDVAAVSFRETSADDADMNFGNLASAPTTQAYARIPTASLDATLGGQVREIGGDSLDFAEPGEQLPARRGPATACTRWFTKIGHAWASATRVPITPRRASRSPTAPMPNMRRTHGPTRSCPISTRARSARATSTSTSRQRSIRATPLIHDIAAIQRIYGADMTTRTGDTVYGFNRNAGRDTYDFTKTPAPIMAIWDAGGNDTIDASGYATQADDRLTPGSLSSIGGVTFDTAPTFAQVNANRAAAGFGPVARATYDANMAAASGQPGSGPADRQRRHRLWRDHRERDRRFGCRYHHRQQRRQHPASGNAGNDCSPAGAGNDLLDGGTGDDEMLGGLGDDRLIVDSAGDRVVELAGEGIEPCPARSTTR